MAFPRNFEIITYFLCQINLATFQIHFISPLLNNPFEIFIRNFPLCSSLRFRTRFQTIFVAKKLFEPFELTSPCNSCPGIPIQKSIRGVHNEKLIHTYARFIHDDSVSPGSGRVGWKLDRSGGGSVGSSVGHAIGWKIFARDRRAHLSGRTLGTQLQHRKHNQQLSRRNQPRLSSEPGASQACNNELVKLKGTQIFFLWKEILVYIYIYILYVSVIVITVRC